MQERILVIKHGAMGDFIFAIGSMEAIREKHPDAHISLMTMGMFTDIARQLGYFDDIIIDNRVSYWNLAANYRAIAAIIKGNFDIIYDLQASSRTTKRYAPIVRFFSTRSYAWSTRGGGNSWYEKKAWGPGRKIEIDEKLPNKLSDLSRVHGKNEHFGELPEQYVVLIPGCSPGHSYKRWSPKNYSVLAQRLAEKGIHSVIIGTEAEREEIEQIAASTPMAHNFLGKTTILDIPDLAARAIACVGNDTGPTHMSAYCGRPVISLFSIVTNSPVKYLKQVPGAIPLVSPKKDINLITVDQVWEHLEPHLGGK